MTAVFPLFEHSHGLKCARCLRVILQGQPYQSVETAMFESGDTFAELVCVYCLAVEDRLQNLLDGKEGGTP